MTLQAGFDPLFRAISEGKLDILEQLFCTGKFSVNEEVYYYSEDDKNYIITPLYWAVKLERREICGYLLQNGADPYRHTVYEYYPLHEACNKGNSGIVQEFIDANCNLNKPNCDGDTPLHIACLRGHKECIRLLLSAGASRNERNNKGHTPLQVAQFDQQTELYRLFEKDFSPSSRVRTADGMKQAPPFSGRRRSLTSAHYSKLTRPLSYHAHDDASVNRLKSLRSDVTRTFSFSGSNSNHYPYYRDTRTLKDASIVAHSRKDSPAIKTPSQRPSLSYMSHDSQLVLPTQVLIPDPRRTQTCHEFKTLPAASKLDHRLKTPSPDPSPSPEPPLLSDDVEADAIHPRQSNIQSGRVRISHMVQCMQHALKSRDTSDSVDMHNDWLRKVLFSIHKEVGYSDNDYTAINRLIAEREEACGNRPSSSGQMGGELEYVWGCDYELVRRHPLQVESLENCQAELTLHVRLMNEQYVLHRGRDSFLKVIVRLFNLEEAGQFEVHSGNHDDQSKEGRVLSSLPPHPNIIKYYHHCLASSRPFERFSHHFGENDSLQKFRLSPQCSLIFTEYFSNSLEDLVNSKSFSHECSRPTTRFGTSEKTLLLHLAQLLLAAVHLDSHDIILGCISASKVFIDKNHLYFADFSFAHDLQESSDKTSLKNWLDAVPEEVLLKFPPELCEINDTPVSISDSIDYKRSLKKCNVYSIGMMFKRLITQVKTSRDFYECAKISEHFRYLLEKLVCDYDHRLSSIEAVMFCLSLLYGPTYNKCNTLDACQEWLIAETFHLFLQPSLKGHPTSYKPDVQTKLLFAYLCLATPEKLLATLEMGREVTATKRC